MVWHIIYIGARVGTFRLLFFVYIGDDEGRKGRSAVMRIYKEMIRCIYRFNAVVLF